MAPPGIQSSSGVGGMSSCLLEGMMFSKLINKILLTVLLEVRIIRHKLFNLVQGQAFSQFTICMAWYVS
jgi:hypothetical protein